MFLPRKGKPMKTPAHTAANTDLNWHAHRIWHPGQQWTVSVHWLARKTFVLDVGLPPSVEYCLEPPPGYARYRLTVNGAPAEPQGATR